jgi:hypothetical protein
MFFASFPQALAAPGGYTYAYLRNQVAHDLIPPKGQAIRTLYLVPGEQKQFTSV